MSGPMTGSSPEDRGPHAMMNGYSVTSQDAPAPTGRHRWTGAPGAGGGGKAGRVFPHLDDLVAQSNPQLDIHAPMKTLLHKADMSAKAADTHLDFHRPDLAYVEYLTAFSIIVNLVPRHKDFPTLSSNRGELWQLNRGLQKRINSQHEKFVPVRELIKEDNARSGIRPATANGLPGRDGGRQASLAPYEGISALAMPDGPVRNPSPAPQAGPAVTEESGRSPGRKERPPVQPKPYTLHGRSLVPNGHRADGDVKAHPPDALLERFVNLRRADQGRQFPSRPTSRPTSSSSWHNRESSNEPLTPVEFTPSSSVTSLPALSQASSISAAGKAPPRPSGPRTMPNGPPAGPPHPPKIPLNTQLAAAMPRPPSPTYSPARNPPVPESIDPLLVTARVVASTAPRPTSLPMANTTSRSSAADSGARWSNGPTPSVGQTRAVDLPQEAMISAETLIVYLKRGSDHLSILFIDVRSRDRFDEGHVFAQSVICVDPVVLRPDISAEELEEALVLSPEQEQALFGRRQEFDLVVYYDQSEDSRRSLAYLHRALADFSYEKPLQRSPVVLEGGLDAWIGLVGEQGLQTSSTAGPGRSSAAAGRKNGRPLGRVSMASQTARLEARRRLREQEPLDVDEEKAWLERVQGDGGVRSRPRSPSQSGVSQTSAASSRQQASASAGDEDASFVRTYDDFLRRYPEPSSMRESMTSPSASASSRSTIIDHPFHNFTGIQPPPRQQSAAALEAESLVPAAPSRPPPSVPRPSYSGVSEKISYQTRPQAYPTPVPSAQATPADGLSSRPHAQVSRTGLTNFGATCYMNAVIQCLSATAPLTRYFLDGGYQRAVQRNKWGSNGILPKVYHSLMWHLWRGEYTYIAPKTFREFVSRLNKDFENASVQHDANDFLVFILDALHEDLNVNFDEPRLANLTETEERRREQMPAQIAARIEWGRWSARNRSWVSSLFSGQHMSRLRCAACGFQSTSYETFNSIALEVPKKGRAHIYDCLKNYTREERLSAGDCWTCPDCRVPREATKRITITRAPQILVVQLKRFRSVRRGFTDKSNTMVEFPLTGLDLTPYALGPLRGPEEAAARRQFHGEITEPLHETTPPYEYDAYGVVQHFGTLTGGHYKALVREDTRGRWVEFNDRVVTSFDARRVQSEAAYLLFYVRSKVQ
ncbi:MAG: ubiquitin-specific protease doa4 [Thelocarpon impressellum]|nr:MAG: ubiquitin-specific protease doa4 [Thelocarpon impressellum]